MGRLCERPGCSEDAAVAYGMRPEDLVFWLDAIGDLADADGGVLCRRHADSMVVPRGWTLDDLRDPDLHLFRPPAGDAPTRTHTRRVRRRTAVEQLELGVDDAGPDDRGALATDPVDDADHVDSAETPWTPEFDTSDDLDGLLSARSPLLARAFRGDDRRR